VFEGAIPVLAGSRRTNMNTPFGITGDYSRQHETHLMTGDQFPFTYDVLTDVIRGKTDGIFARCRVTSTCPKLFHADSDTEIFQARASLVVTSPDGKPLTLPDNVRAYFLAGSQHGPAAAATQPREDDALGKVTVRARNRLEPLKDVPLAISVVTGGELERLNAFDIDSITKTISDCLSESTGVRG